MSSKIYQSFKSKATFCKRIFDLRSSARIREDFENAERTAVQEAILAISTDFPLASKQLEALAAWKVWQERCWNDARPKPLPAEMKMLINDIFNPIFFLGKLPHVHVFEWQDLRDQAYCAYCQKEPYRGNFRKALIRIVLDPLEHWHSEVQRKSDIFSTVLHECCHAFTFREFNMRQVGFMRFDHHRKTWRDLALAVENAAEIWLGLERKMNVVNEQSELYDQKSKPG